MMISVFVGTLQSENAIAWCSQKFGYIHWDVFRKCQDLGEFCLEWQTGKNRWIYISTSDTTEFIFRDANDALLFKMIWG